MEEELIPNELIALTKVQHTEPLIGESLSVSTIWSVSAGFLSLVVLILIFILLRRWWQNKQEAREQAHIDRYQAYLAEFTAISVAELFEELDVKSNNTYSLTKKDLQKSKRRRLLAYEIYQLHLNLEGTQAHALKTLYLGLSLLEDTRKNLSSRTTEVVILALREIKAYRLKELLPQVEELLLYKNEDIRNAALYVYIDFFPNKLGIIEKYTSPLTDWQKHKILFGLQQNNRIKESYLADLAAQESIHVPFYQELQAILFPSPVHYEQEIKQLIFS